MTRQRFTAAAVDDGTPTRFADTIRSTWASVRSGDLHLGRDDRMTELGSVVGRSPTRNQPHVLLEVGCTHDLRRIGCGRRDRLTNANKIECLRDVK